MTECLHLCRARTINPHITACAGCGKVFDDRRDFLSEFGNGDQAAAYDTSMLPMDMIDGYASDPRVTSVDAVLWYEVPQKQVAWSSISDFNEWPKGVGHETATVTLLSDWYSRFKDDDGMLSEAPKADKAPMPWRALKHGVP